jgi:hypothetical protein
MECIIYHLSLLKYEVEGLQLLRANPPNYVRIFTMNSLEA